jgi:hypothetical protein
MLKRHHHSTFLSHGDLKGHGQGGPDAMSNFDMASATVAPATGRCAALRFALRFAPFLLCFAVLCCAVLCCAVLCCAV